ncbi:aldo/keto reductase [Arthrobacter glacialis]|uniref:aldo/keto reductase n=1 Tax=Arthrobacter glacialis TaxID=1664 RepID=UPI000CD419E1|nr:aldo/keto reductase [Arthrobacter glacialis]POH57445.1 aldo/keto reductase [Arthrobacter glacialis]
MIEYRQVGRSGLTVSTVGLGCNNLGRSGTVTQTQEGSNAVVRAALEAGITHFDVADVYGMTPGMSETILGKALGAHRENVIVATKFGMDTQGANGVDWGRRGSRKYIMQSVEASLRRLNTDYLDLFYYHTPDGHTPMAETLSALDDLIRAGKVRYLGHSNLAGWQIADAEYTARTLGTERFVASQNHYNLLDRRAEQEVTPAAEAYGLGVMPYFPLANGLLTGKYRGGVVPEGSRLSHTRQHMVSGADQDQFAAFSAFAAARGLTEVQVAFSWLAAQPSVASVIAGATKPEQVRENAAAAGWKPTTEDLTELDLIFPRTPKVALF